MNKRKGLGEKDWNILKRDKVNIAANIVSSPKFRVINLFS